MASGYDLFLTTFVCICWGFLWIFKGQVCARLVLVRFIVMLPKLIIIYIAINLCFIPAQEWNTNFQIEFVRSPHAFVGFLHIPSLPHCPQTCRLAWLHDSKLILSVSVSEWCVCPGDCWDSNTPSDLENVCWCKFSICFCNVKKKVLSLYVVYNNTPNSCLFFLLGHNRKYPADLNVKFPDTTALVGQNITLECFALGK